MQGPACSLGPLHKGEHMKRTIQGIILAGSLVLGGAALSQGGVPGQAARDSKMMMKGGMVEFRGFMVPTDEQAFLERLHYTNQMEVKLAQLAQQNSTNPDVKSFADMMQKEHTALDQKLMSLAQQRGLKLAATPTPMNDMERRAMATDKALMEELRMLKGDAFDSVYMSNMVADHDETLGKMMAGQKAFTQPPLSTMLTEATQNIAKHRQHAYSVLGKVGPSMTMGVGGAGTQGRQMGTGSGSMGPQQPGGTGPQK